MKSEALVSTLQCFPYLAHIVFPFGERDSWS